MRTRAENITQTYGFLTDSMLIEAVHRGNSRTGTSYRTQPQNMVKTSQIILVTLVGRDYDFFCQFTAL
jgi:hypothetical protein